MSLPKSETAADLREQARLIRETADRVRAEAEREAKALEAAAGILEGRTPHGLTSTGDSTSESTVGQTNVADSTEKTRALARGRGRSKSLADGHAFAKALYARGMTATNWAKLHKQSLATVSAWMARSENGKRRIPLEWAKKIEKEFGKGADGKPLLPATQVTWPNGITD